MGVNLYEDPKKVAKRVWEGLRYFSIIRSSTPEDAAVLKRLRLFFQLIQGELDVLTPGYREE